MPEKVKYADQIRMTAEHPERAAVIRCIRIAMERAFIEKGRKDQHWHYASQVARDIAVLHGIDCDSLTFDDAEQRRIRRLYWPDQRKAAREGAHE